MTDILNERTPAEELGTIIRNKINAKIGLEVVESLESISNPQSNVLYLIPKGE